jgi:hypothetical protein
MQKSNIPARVSVHRLALTLPLYGSRSGMRRYDLSLP